MTYAELYREVEKLNTTGPFCIRVSTWKHLAGEITTTWDITTFDGDVLTHSISDLTPEGALALLRLRLAEVPEPQNVEQLVIDPPATPPIKLWMPLMGSSPKS